MDGACFQEHTEKRFDVRLCFAVDHREFSVDLVSFRQMAGADFVSGFLCVQHLLDPLSGPVCFVLGYGQHDIDL